MRDRVTATASTTPGALKAFRREAVQRLRLYRGMHRFLPALLQMEGMRVTELPVSHRPRRAGVSKYGNWRRLWTGLADLWAVRWMARRRLDYEIEDEAGEKARTLLLAIGVAAVLALEAVPFYTDWLWFEEVGYLAVFLRIAAATRGGLPGVGLLTFVFLTLNLRAAVRARPRTCSGSSRSRWPAQPGGAGAAPPAITRR